MWPFSRKSSVVPRVEVLNLQPGDFLVFETHERLSAEQADELRTQFADFTGMDGNRLIVVHNATLKVLRQGDPPPPPLILAPATEFRF